MRMTAKAKIAAELSEVWDLHTKLDARLEALHNAGKITSGAAYLVYNRSNNYGLKRYLKVGFRYTSGYNRTTARRMAVILERARKEYEEALAFVEDHEISLKYPQLDGIDWDSITTDDVVNTVESAFREVAPEKLHIVPFIEPTVHIRYILHESGTYHATMFNGSDRQTIAVQRGFFVAITGTGRNAVLGAVEVTPAIAAALGFIVPVVLTEGVVAV